MGAAVVEEETGAGAVVWRVEGGAAVQRVQIVLVDVITTVLTVGTTEVIVDPAETDVTVAEQLVTVVMTISVVTIWEVSRVVVGTGVVAITLVEDELTGTTTLDEAGRTDVKGVVVDEAAGADVEAAGVDEAGTDVGGPVGGASPHLGQKVVVDVTIVVDRVVETVVRVWFFVVKVCVTGQLVTVCQVTTVVTMSEEAGEVMRLDEDDETVVVANVVAGVVTGLVWAEVVVLAYGAVVIRVDELL